MSIWTDMSVVGVRRQIATNVLLTHVFSGFTLWELVVSIPYDWNAFSGRRGCRWGAFILYMNTRYLFLCSTISTLVFVDMYATKFVRGLGTFFQISGHVANGFAYAILALRLMIIWRNPTVTLLMVACQLILWAMTFAAFPRIIDGFQERSSHLRLTSTLLGMSTIMLTSACWGLIVSYRGHIKRLSANKRIGPQEQYSMHSVSHYTQMLWQEGIQFFAVAWLGQMMEALARYLNIDRSALLQLTLEYAALSMTVISACRVYQEMTTHCDACPTDEYRIFWRSARTLSLSSLSILRSLLTPKRAVTPQSGNQSQRPRNRWKFRMGEDDVGTPQVDAPTIGIVLNPLSGKNKAKLEDSRFVSGRTSIATQSVA